MSTSIPTGSLWCPELGRSLPLDLSVGQAAALVGRSQRTMYRLFHAGQVRGTAIQGGDIRIATVPLLTAYGLTVRQHAMSNAAS